MRFHRELHSKAAFELEMARAEVKWPVLPHVLSHCPIYQQYNFLWDFLDVEKSAAKAFEGLDKISPSCSTVCVSG